MCGICGIAGPHWEPAQLEAMIHVQHHRGPDDQGRYISPDGWVGLGHNRLSIIDLSPAGHQPMANHRGDTRIVFNGEVYNYLELREELQDYPYTSRSDTEVILAAYDKWGPACLEHFIGMFVIMLWDERRRRLFIARDRFGVKPLYYTQQPDGIAFFASEIKTLFAAGHPPQPSPAAWAHFMVKGTLDDSNATFWEGVTSLPAGHYLLWEDGKITIHRWYNLAERVGQEFDSRPMEAVQAEYLDLLTASVRLRFRSDVPVGMNLSGGLDSSTLVGLVKRVLGGDELVKAFTFITNHPDYDELPWVRPMLAETRYEPVTCALAPEDVPGLAASVQYHQDEPYGGLPTLAYARLFEIARAQGVIVLLDGQGMDEQWAGYDYYQTSAHDRPAATVQGTRQSPVRPGCLARDFRALAEDQGDRRETPAPFPDRLRNLQYRDAFISKIPRALRYNDRISMRVSTELREPFLDHRLFELAFRQPAESKIRDGQGKWLLREMTRALMPAVITNAPKRPLQTPQREWLRGPLKDWAAAQMETAFTGFGGAWLDPQAVRKEWQAYLDGQSDNSYYVWQWISLGLASSTLPRYGGHRAG